MRNIRIGKDFDIKWRVFRKEGDTRSPYEFEDDVRLKLVSAYGSTEVTGWTIVGNMLSWTFRGKDQKYIGPYQLVLIENDGNDGMVTVDICDAFNLVAHSCQETGATDNGDVVVETLYLTSDVELAPQRTIDNFLSKESANPVENRVITMALEQKQNLIKDLDSIRAGAAKGETALQSVPAGYVTTGGLEASMLTKQDTITDLAEIRSGAAKGATALQTHQDISGLATKTEVAQGLSGKVSVEEGKQLSTEDYTTAEKNKLASIDIPNLENKINAKQDAISDLAIIKSGAAKGATSVQPSDLEDYATKAELERGLSGKQDTLIDGKTIKTINGVSILGEGNIIVSGGGGSSGGMSAEEVIQLVDSRVAGKVDKVQGKGLSTEDFTTTEKNKLAGLRNYDDTEIRGILSGKQDVISDLETIREGAAKGATALQSHQSLSHLATKTEVTQGLNGKQDVITDLAEIRAGANLGKTALQSHQDISGLAVKTEVAAELLKKVDKIEGKQLSTEDFTTALKTKLQGLNNYDDAEIKLSLAGKQDAITDLNAIRQGASLGLTSVQDISHLATKNELTQGLSGKQDVISDLESIRSGAAKGATALQSHQDISHLATKTEVTQGLNGKQDVITDLAEIRAGANLGKTALQEHQDISHLATKTEVADAISKAISEAITIALNTAV